MALLVRVRDPALDATSEQKLHDAARRIVGSRTDVVDGVGM